MDDHKESLELCEEDKDNFNIFLCHKLCLLLYLSE